MKKILLIVLVILLSAGNTQAKELSNKNIDFNGGVSYGNYLYKKYDMVEINGSDQKTRDTDYFVREDLHQGIGYYGELIYWFNEKLGLGVGWQRNKMTAEWQEEIIDEENSIYEYTCNLNSYYTKLIYSLQSNFKPYLTINYNVYNEHYEKENFATDIKRGAGLGLTVGTEYSFLLTEKLGFKFNTGYNLTEIKITEKYSSYSGELIDVNNESLRINGLQVKGGIYYNF